MQLLSAGPAQLKSFMAEVALLKGAVASPPLPAPQPALDDANAYQLCGSRLHRRWPCGCRLKRQETKATRPATAQSSWLGVGAAVLAFPRRAAAPAQA